MNLRPPAPERRVLAFASLWTALFALTALPWIRASLGLDAELGGHAHDGYVEIARSLAAGHGFVFEAGGDPVFHRPPLYPLLIAPLMLFPESAHRALLSALDIAFLAGTCALVFHLARRWYGVGAGAVAAVLIAANPWLLLKIGVGMPPLMQTFLFTAFVVALVPTLEVDPAPESPARTPRILLLGLPAAALVLTHGAMLATVALLLAGAALVSVVQRRWEMLPTFAMAGAAVALCVLPWTLRNQEVTGRLMPVAGNVGFAYLVGKVHWQDVPADLRKRTPQRELIGAQAGEAALRLAGVEGPLEEHYHFYGLRDPALDAELNRLMRRDIAAAPLAFARRIGLNALEYFAPVAWPLLVRGDDTPPLRSLLRWKNKTARSLASSGLLLLAVVGVLRARGRARLRSAALLFAVFAFASPYFLLLAARSDYTLGVVPFLSLLTALGLGFAPRGDAQGA